ncbi:Uncharacterised protein [Acinetobacter baumannii]|nr:Uncharacterised protein [Acinetobacter baumannii]
MPKASDKYRDQFLPDDLGRWTLTSDVLQQGKGGSVAQ